MACIETFATLRIFSKEIHPDEISKLLDVSPTKIIPIDLESKYKKRREFHLWAFSTKELLKSVDNLEHIQLIFKKIQSKSDQLNMLREEGCDTDIFCFWNSSGQGGPIASIELMKNAVELGLGITWDIYFDDENT